MNAAATIQILEKLAASGSHVKVTYTTNGDTQDVSSMFDSPRCATNGLTAVRAVEASAKRLGLNLDYSVDRDDTTIGIRTCC